MTKFRVIIRQKPAQKTKDGTYNIKIRMSHRGDARDIATDIYVKPEQLDGIPIIDHPSASLYNIRLRNLLNLYETKKEELGGKINDMDAKALMNYLKGIDQSGCGRLRCGNGTILC